MEIENSLGEFSLLLTPTGDVKQAADEEKLENIRSLAFDLFTGISSIKLIVSGCWAKTSFGKILLINKITKNADIRTGKAVFKFKIAIK